MDKNKKIFIIVSILFVLVMIGFSIHFMTMTSSPWTKEKVQQKYRVK